MKSDSTIELPLTPAGELDSAGCAPTPGSEAPEVGSRWRIHKAECVYLGTKEIPYGNKVFVCDVMEIPAIQFTGGNFQRYYFLPEGREWWMARAVRLPNAPAVATAPKDSD